MPIAGQRCNGAHRRGPDLGSITMQRIALISEHASPLGVIGGVDAGGQNIYVANVAKQLAERGLDVDVYTRCDNAHLPEVVQISPRMRVIHVPAGPADRCAEGAAAAVHGGVRRLHDRAHAARARPRRRDARELLHVGRSRPAREEAPRHSARHDLPRARPRAPAASGRGRRLSRRALQDRGHARAPLRPPDRRMPAGCARPDHALPRGRGAHRDRAVRVRCAGVSTGAGAPTRVRSSAGSRMRSSCCSSGVWCRARASTT